MLSDPLVPVRTCVGCRRVAPTTELIRVVAAPGQGLQVGRSLPGRGAWLCAGSSACIEAARRQRAFPRALRAAVRSEAVVALSEAVAGRGRIEGGHAVPERRREEEKET